MAIPLSNEIRASLDGPNFVHLATLMPDGSPQSVPVWVGREDDRVLICTGEGSLKGNNTKRDPRKESRKLVIVSVDQRNDDLAELRTGVTLQRLQLALAEFAPVAATDPRLLQPSDPD
jgi:hypothetical protein